MGLARLSMEDSVLRHTRETERWGKLLRSACATLAGTPRDIVESVSVTAKPSDVEGEAVGVLTLSKRLAAEHGLTVAVEVQGHCLTVRFRRRTLELLLFRKGERP